MMVYGCAAAGILAGGWFGRYQMKRWEIYEKKLWIPFLAGLLAVFLPGACVMQMFGYHVLKMIRYWIVMYALLLLALMDYKKRIIPNQALLVLVSVRTLLMAAECLCFPEVWAELLVSSLAGMLGGGLIFLAAGLVVRRGLGMGDIKMIAVVGYYLGFQVLMSDMVISLLLTVIGGIGNLVIRKASMHSEMPFAPFAAAGTWITILLGC